MARRPLFGDRAGDGLDVIVVDATEIHAIELGGVVVAGEPSNLVAARTVYGILDDGEVDAPSISVVTP